MHDTIKCVVVGNGGVGKTSLLISYTKGTFPTEYVPTVFENHSIAFEINANRVINLLLFDTAGQEEFDRLRPLAYPQSNVILICFSLVDRESYKEVKKKWHPEVRLHCPDVPIILVGTKSDLRSNTRVLERLEIYDQKPITHSQGIEMMNEIKAVAYLGLGHEIKII